MRRERLLFLMLSLAATAPFVIFILHLSVLDSAAGPQWEAVASPDDQQSEDTSSDDTSTKGTIAYAISLTGCGNDLLVQGSAVLAHSIHLNSAANPESKSQYSYKLFAFIHPDAVSCSKAFADVGYELLVRDTPVNVSDIRGEFLRTNVHKIGCCGEKEYLKLYSYQLMDYPVAVHFDMDCIVLRPLDDLFDVMIEGPEAAAAKNVPVMFGAALPDKVDAFFTRDYNMINPGKKYPGFQGGFLVVRPNLDVFREFVNIILEGNFVQGQGWNRTFGGYWGAQQIQGLCSYYYDGIHPGTAVELNRCIYNQMVDKPKKIDPKNKDGGEKCADGRDECEDCRATNIQQIYSAHFTQECGKPWDCRLNDRPLCRELHKAWHLVRSDFDKVTSGDITIPGSAEGKHLPETFQGHCAGPGPNRYIPFQLKQTTRR